MARFLTYVKSPWTIILLVSVLLFTFWGGPVFTAPSLSQGGRLMVSYLFIPLAVAAVLLWKRRWEWSSFGYYTVSLALVKMVITMTVHLWVVPRGERMQARAVPAAHETGVTYTGGLLDHWGQLVGNVHTGSKGPRGFAALLDIRSGKSAQVTTRVVSQRQGEFSPEWVLATIRDQIRVVNLDSIPHTFVLSDSVGQLLQVPLPPGSPGAERPLLRAGSFVSRCSYDHPGEGIPVWVFAHPYHALLDTAGNFSLDQVPPGTFQLGVWTNPMSPRPALIEEVHVESGRTVTLTLNPVEQDRKP